MAKIKKQEREPMLLLAGSVAALGVMALLMTIGMPRKEIRDLPAETAALADKHSGSVIVKSQLKAGDTVGVRRAAMRRNYRPFNATMPISDTGLPSMLSEEDRLLYRRAFSLQQQGKWEQAQAYTDQIVNPLLMGHLKAQKYLHPDYASNHMELLAWLEEYKDQPQAKKIHALARKKAPNAGIQKIALGSQRYLHGYGESNGLNGKVDETYAYMLNWSGRAHAKALWQNVIAQVNDGAVTDAARMLNGQEARTNLQALEQDLALWRVADAYFAHGKDKPAFTAAAAAAKRSGDALPGAHWTAGLAAWRLGNIEQSAAHFGTLAKAKKVSAWQRSAGAYWAYRANRRLHRTDSARNYLRIAARYPRAFYGILARSTLGQSLDLDLEPVRFSGQNERTVLGVPAVQRAIALTEIGHHERAERELRSTFPQVSGELGEGLLVVAQKLKLSAVQIRMANHMIRRNPSYKSNQKYLDFAKYPIPEWCPKEGYEVDPALIFALMRLESGFNVQARSRVGARGLMQIMPTTAQYIADRRQISHTDTDMLFDPTHNVSLGQAYVDYLMNMKNIGSNLVYVLSSYNAGPGNTIRWQKNIKHDGDPLLFMESIPIPETRNYVGQVLTNYWIYREILGQPNPSLKAVTAGNWPKYEPPVSHMASIF